MSDTKEDEKDFAVDRAKNARAACKKCKNKCEKDSPRIAKLTPNFFSDSGKMKHYFHVDCIFESFKTQKATTKKIETIDDIEGVEILSEQERDELLEKIQEIGGIVAKKAEKKQLFKVEPSATQSTSYLSNYNENSDDNLFKTFREICDKIGSVSSYLKKSSTLQAFLIKGTNGKKFEGNIFLWFKMLLPSAVKRIYNLQSKQIVKLFSKIFRTDHQEMLTDLEQGDVSETVRKFFLESNSSVTPNKKNRLTLLEVDEFLERLAKLTKEEDQIECFRRFCQKSDSDDMKTVIRLIKHDLRINAGPRHILDALNPIAYTTFQTSRDLEMVVSKFAPLITQNKINVAGSGSGNSSAKKTSGGSASGTGGVQLMSPISPMLAEACKSVERAITKNPEGMYSEIKYDGERVQIHKCGNEFRFFTRNLKPVMEHKISRCKEFIPKAFPTGQDLILDSEIILVDTKTGALLPFGTLGVHKQGQLASSEVCLFVFDCIYFNGEDLTKRPLIERKKILKENIKPIKHHVELSEYYLLRTKKELASMTAKVLKSGLEGLVLKNIKSHYKPGKRGWLKIKKDYLFEGQMADSADLVVLGAWFGTGKKGGMLSIFLMGCYDKKMKIWKTVTKVHSGLDDSTMEALQDELNELMERANADRPPKWIMCKKPLMPDLIAKDPFAMPVWEITGAEFTQTESHTANGISIRFPRITKIRHDKSTAEATSLKELEELLKKSKEHINIDMLFKDIDLDGDDDEVDIKTKFFDPTRNTNQTIDAMEREEEEKEEEQMERKNSKRKSDESKPETQLKGIKLEAIDDFDRKDATSSISPKKKIKLEGVRAKCEPFADDEEDRSNKVKLKKVMSSERSNVKEEKIDIKLSTVKVELEGIFNGVTLYVRSDASSQFRLVKELFLSHGGVITKESLSATHALHESYHNQDDFFILRQRFRPICRHITIDWLTECIEEKKLVTTVKFAVIL